MEDLIFYHASPNKFDQFDDYRTGGVGFYFAKNIEALKGTAKAGSDYIYVVKLHLKNPCSSELYFSTTKTCGGGNPRGCAAQKLKAMGYDGLYDPNFAFVIAFNSSEIEILEILDNTKGQILGENFNKIRRIIREQIQNIINENISPELSAARLFFEKSIIKFAIEHGGQVIDDKFVVLYHGTNSANAKKIIQSGKFLSGTFFALDKKDAEKFGAQSISRGAPVILTAIVYAGALTVVSEFVSLNEPVYEKNGRYLPSDLL